MHAIRGSTTPCALIRIKYSVRVGRGKLRVKRIQGEKQFCLDFGNEQEGKETGGGGGEGRRRRERGEERERTKNDEKK